MTLTRRRVLVAVSAGQLATGVVGTALGVRRRHAYHWLFLHGDARTVGRDWALQGTGLSAPLTMLATQLLATAALSRRRWQRPATLTLGGLGAAMVPGYLGEAIVRERLRPGGWEPVESPVAVAGVTLALVMAVLAWPSVRPRPAG